MNQAETVTTTFTKDPKTLAVLGAGAGAGTVMSTSAGINCTISAGAASGTCSFDFAHGTQVTLTPTPATGSTFSSWGGSCSGSGACVVTMDQQGTVTATFGLDLLAPTISTGTVTLQELNGPSCTIGNTNVGSLFQFAFDYTDPDGDVVPGVTIRVDWTGPGSTGFRLITDPTISGDGFSGSMSYLVCWFFGSDTVITTTQILTDVGQNPSNQLQIILPRPSGANLRVDGGAGSGAVPNSVPR